MPSTAPRTIIIEKDSRTSWIEYLREALARRYLLKMLVKRELKARYKNSILGVLWNLLNPLFMMLVYTMVFTVLRPGSNVRIFYIFILVALVPWNFLSGSLLSGASAIINDSALVKKVAFPRILLPTAIVVSNLVNFFFAFAILLLFLFISGIGLTVYALWIPVIVFIQFMFVLGLVLILSSLNVFYRDVGMILNVAVMAWFFLTPVLYPFEDFQESASLAGITFDAARIMRWLNPMASIIDGYRTVLWGTVSSEGPVSMEPLSIVRTFLTALIVLIIGYLTFRRTEPLFAEKL